MSGGGGDRVRSQYEDYPYPARDAADERGRLITGSPSLLLELNHYVFGGRRDFALPFRALVAGGGTGDGAIMLAQQLTDAGDASEVVYIDISKASLEIARARAKARGLGNISFHRLSLLDLGAADFAPFDYIDCCGVLHHLADPAAGLAALKQNLSEDDGGIGIMLYGALGRTGVYPMQEMLRALGKDQDGGGQRIALARRLLAQLPETNWLKRNPFVGDHLDGGDAGLFDLLLHSRDRAYRVPEIAELAAGAGLSVTAFIEPAHYDPASYLDDPEIAARLEPLSWIERAAFAELLAGNMSKHIFYAVPESQATDAVASPAPDMVPSLRGIDGPAFAQGLKPGARITAEINGATFRFPLPPAAGAIIGLIDGARSIGEIEAEIDDRQLAGGGAFDGQFRALYAALNGLGKLFLSQPQKPL